MITLGAFEMSSLHVNLPTQTKSVSHPELAVSGER